MTSLVITADRLWDGTGTPAQRHARLEIRDGIIAAVQDDSPPAVESPAQRYHFPGCTVLPGLIDTHVHLVMAALATNEAIVDQVTRETDPQRIDRIAASAAAALRSGLTTIRDCGGTKNHVQLVRDRIRRGEIPGPDVLSCGSPITTSRGHCHWLGLTADTKDEVERAAHRMLAEQADFLKVMATGGNMTPSSDPLQAQYDAPTLLSIADIGRGHGVHAAAHVLSRVALPSVVAARYRTIEHCDWRVEEFRYEFDPELARRIVAQNQFVGLTMSGLPRRAFLPEMRVADTPLSRRLDARLATERQMIEFGIRFTIHSDAGVRLCPIDQFVLGLRAAELELRLRPDEVLRAATSTAAEAIGLLDRGTLEVGRRADLIVVAGDPTRDLTSLEQLQGVMKAGRWCAEVGRAPRESPVA